MEALRKIKSGKEDSVRLEKEKTRLALEVSKQNYQLEISDCSDAEPQSRPKPKGKFNKVVPLNEVAAEE